MDVFDYIGETNADCVYDLCQSYGYDMSSVSPDQAGQCARQLVADNGEQAFLALMDNHPDKDFFITTYSPGNANLNRPQTLADSLRSVVQYKNADGAGAISAAGNHTGVMIIGAALLISIAIIASRH